MILSKLRSEQRASLDIANPRDPVIASWFGNSTASGASVTEETAITLGAVYAAVRVLTEGVAGVPLILHKQVDDRTTEKAIKHPLYKVLKQKPNEWQTSFEFREMMQGHLCLRGNAYAQKVITNRGFVDQLIPLHPDSVVPFWANQEHTERAYEYTPVGGSKQILLQDEMFHVSGLSFNGLAGMNPIQNHREMLGSSLAARDYGSRFYANDATPSGILTHPGHFKDKESKAGFAEAWQAARTGANRHKTAVLEDGMNFQKISLTPEESQYLEGQKFTINEIARMFRIPPHLIGDLSKSSFSNITQQSLEFIIYSLTPWFVRWEQAITRDLLLTELEQGRYFAKHNVDALLRGDIKTRFDAYHLGITDGHLTRNEARVLEDRNPLEGLDEPLQMMNMGDGGEKDEEPGNQAEDDETGQDGADMGEPGEESGNQDDERARKLTESAIKRIISKESQKILKIMERNNQDNDRVEALSIFWTAHRSFVEEVLCLDTDEAEGYIIASEIRLIESINDGSLDQAMANYEEVQFKLLLSEAGYE